MLLRLEVENFYSIRDRQVLDFRVPGTTPKSGRYGQCTEACDDRAPHVIAIFGANASGKTSLLRAVGFMKRFLTDSFGDYKPEQSPLLRPFDTKETEHGVTKLAMEFAPSPFMADVWLKHEFESETHPLYRYELNISHGPSRAEVTWESIKFSNGDRVFSSLFDRESTGDTYKVRAHKSFQLSASDPRRNARKNVSLVSSLIQFDHAPARHIARMFGHSFFSNLYIDKLDRDENDVAEFIAESEGLLSILDGKLRIIDLGIEGVETKEVDGKKQLIFAHSGLDYLQPLRHESQGTRSFITNFPDVILALQSGGVAIMDELDADLHPHLMAEIIRWFQDEGENEHHAQLIMSCHNASLIGDLEKDEVWFASKDSHGATSFIALSSFRGIRRGANLYSKYLSGQFGAIPKFG